MKLYQVEHNNCEPYEDNFHFREEEVYTNKENLIKRIKNEGYKEETSYRGEQEFTKGDPRGFDGMDMITIHELNIVDCDINIKKGN